MSDSTKIVRVISGGVHDVGPEGETFTHIAADGTTTTHATPLDQLTPNDVARLALLPFPLPSSG